MHLVVLRPWVRRKHLGQTCQRANARHAIGLLVGLVWLVGWFGYFSTVFYEVFVQFNGIRRFRARTHVCVCDCIDFFLRMCRAVFYTSSL